MLRWLKRHGARPDPRLVIDSFLLALGARGTLLLPLFNFAFTRGVTFDIRSTPSEMGVLTEVGRGYEGVVRTGHPIYSFAALGHGRAAYSGVDNYSGYGPDSPFALLHQARGKVAVLDLPDQNSVTFYHYVEESLAADYRYHKRFTGGYTNADGVTEERTYGLFVRDLRRGVVTHVEPMGEILWRKRLYTGERPNVGFGLRVIEAVALYEETAAVIRSGRAEGVLYRIETAHG